MREVFIFFISVFLFSTCFGEPMALIPGVVFYESDKIYPLDYWFHLNEKLKKIEKIDVFYSQKEIKDVDTGEVVSLSSRKVFWPKAYLKNRYTSLSRYPNYYVCSNTLKEGPYKEIKYRDSKNGKENPCVLGTYTSSGDKRKWDAKSRFKSSCRFKWKKSDVRIEVGHELCFDVPIEHGRDARVYIDGKKIKGCGVPHLYDLDNDDRVDVLYDNYQDTVPIGESYFLHLSGGGDCSKLKGSKKPVVKSKQ